MKLVNFCYTNDIGWNKPLDSLSQNDSPQTLIIVFGDANFYGKPQIIQQVSQSFPNSVMIGCSTAGEILEQTILEESLVGTIVKFDNTQIKVSYAIIEGENNESANESFESGKRIAQDLKQNDLKGVLLLSDGLNVNGSKLVEGINSVLSKNIIVTGGLAADSDRFSQTWVIKDGIPQNKIISAVGFYGENINIGHGSKGGWDIFGPERKVTKSINNELFELDGKPALQLYKEYLGDKAAELPAAALFFPLALRTGENDKKQIVRTILSINEEHQSMIFAGDIPENSLVQLMRANFDRLIDGAAEAALMTKQDINSDKNILSIAISCVGRRLILGERAEEELEAVMEYLPQHTIQIGFYSNGEISPHTSGYCDLHNQTMTLTTITES